MMCVCAYMCVYVCICKMELIQTHMDILQHLKYLLRVLNAS